MANEENKVLDETVVENEKHETMGIAENPELEAERIETEEKCEAEEESEKEAECDAKTLADAKKELGMGGAAFCDELMATCPDVLGRLREQKKTLHGLFEFAYSYALDEYVKKNGRVNGGGYWNLAELAEKYLDPNVKEGFTVKEPKAKKAPAATPAPTPKKENAKKVVEKVAKKAAKDAKSLQDDLFGDLFK